MKPILFIILIAGLVNSYSIVYSQNIDSAVVPYFLINSTPQNAEVYMNGEHRSETPLRIILKDSAQSQFVLKLKGYFDYSFSMDGSNIPQSKDVVLVSKNGIVKTMPAVNENSVYYFNKPRKLIPVTLSAAVMVAAGIAAYVFKSKAMDNNDEYYLTGDPAAIDRKKKNDLIGGISVGVLQVSLTTLLYFLFGDN